MTETAKINRGLKGVYFERSGISLVDGAKGELSYRGYSIHDLATKSSFEEVAYLLIYGDLPSSDGLARFDAALKAERDVPQAVIDIITRIANGHPMTVLRTAVSALVALEPASRRVTEEAFIAAEHGSNASAFAARVTVGTEADLHGAIVVALEYPDPTAHCL